MEESSFCDFVKEKWVKLSKVSYSFVMFGMITKLSRLKMEVQNWEKIKQVESQKDLVEIEAEIQILSRVVDHLHFSIDRKERLL